MASRTQRRSDLRLRTGPGDGGGDRPPPPPPPPRRNIPEIIVILSLPDLLPNGPSEMQQIGIRDAFIHQAEMNGYDNAVVKLVVAPQTAVTWIGVWLVSDPSLPYDQPTPAEFSSYQPPLGISDRNNAFISVNAGTIEREVDLAWASGQIPRHYNSDGNPCFGSDCDIDLNSVSVYFTDLDQPLTPRLDRIYTFVAGRYNPAWPDVNFVATTTDIFSINQATGKIEVTTSTSVEKDTNVLNALTSIFLIIGAFYAAAWGFGSAILPFLAGTIFGVEDFAVHVIDPHGFPGAGALLLQKLFPSTLAVPGLPMVRVIYRKLIVTGATIEGAATFSL
jgi:hypothetical protein